MCKNCLLMARSKNRCVFVAGCAGCSVKPCLAWQIQLLDGAAGKSPYSYRSNMSCGHTGGCKLKMVMLKAWVSTVPPNYCHVPFIYIGKMVVLNSPCPSIKWLFLIIKWSFYIGENGRFRHSLPASHRSVQSSRSNFKREPSRPRCTSKMKASVVLGSGTCWALCFFQQTPLGRLKLKMKVCFVFFFFYVGKCLGWVPWVGIDVDRWGYGEGGGLRVFGKLKIHVA